MSATHLQGGIQARPIGCDAPFKAECFADIPVTPTLKEPSTALLTARFEPRPTIGGPLPSSLPLLKRHLHQRKLGATAIEGKRNRP